MIAIIDYGAGNTASVENVVRSLTGEVIITQSAEMLMKADKLIFPGVGEASFAMERLRQLNLLPTLRTTKKPLLGICLGMQLLTHFSVEGNTECVGIYDASVQRFAGNDVKVPHMGWSKVNRNEDEELFKGINQNTYFYFAHSYFVPVTENSIAECAHGEVFSASMKKNNFYGVQFHPEKSGEAGISLLKNFITL